MRRIAPPVVAIVVLAGLAACGSAGTGDFRSGAEDFIDDQDGFTRDYRDASCDEPDSTDVNTTFACTATGDDGTIYSFTALITGEDTYKVGEDDPGTGAPSTVPTTS